MLNNPQFCCFFYFTTFRSDIIVINVIIVLVAGFCNGPELCCNNYFIKIYTKSFGPCLRNPYLYVSITRTVNNFKSTDKQIENPPLTTMGVK